jgi:hypothetical protein
LQQQSSPWQWLICSQQWDRDITADRIQLPAVDESLGHAMYFAEQENSHRYLQHQIAKARPNGHILQQALYIVLQPSGTS